MIALLGYDSFEKADEKSKDDDAENIFEDTVNSVTKENNEENPGHHSNAKISGDCD